MNDDLRLDKELMLEAHRQTLASMATAMLEAHRATLSWLDPADDEIAVDESTE